MSTRLGLFDNASAVCESALDFSLWSRHGLVIQHGVVACLLCWAAFERQNKPNK